MKEGNTLKVYLKKIMPFILLTMIGVLWYSMEFKYYKSFKETGIIKYGSVESVYIERSDNMIFLNKTEIKQLFDILKERKYRRIFNKNNIIQTEFPDGIYTYDIFIQYKNKNVYILPLRDYIRINSKMYEISPSIGDDVLQEFLEFAVEY
ncbi:MAG: hypothetical protein U9Q80_12235 [Bacillota bacterium]|nr:hypothetical protein [Bacillota bacterium]